jgi:hypothetical protein
MRMKVSQAILIIWFPVAGCVSAALSNIPFAILFSAFMLGCFVDKSGYVKGGD